jgi:pilus assembly protein CpaF
LSAFVSQFQKHITKSFFLADCSMTALSGDQLERDLSLLTQAFERADAVTKDGDCGVRTPGEIFPLCDAAMRAREMEEAWRAFDGEMAGAVEAALDSGRSPPEIAHAIGEIVQGYFRTRGLTLASYELRRLVVDLLTPRDPLVVFREKPPASQPSWTGDETRESDGAVPDGVFAGPPSPLIDHPGNAGPGPLDRLWADRSIEAVLVNGPAAIQVERAGVAEASVERFHDTAHLQDLVRRLAPDPSAGVATFRLRDGGEGVVILPPAAPQGPVVALRRGAAGEATFDRLIASGVLDRPMAGLLGLAARCRLNVLVVGPPRCGKTGLLAALAHALGEARVVTLARHRAFRHASPSRIELVVPADDSFTALLMAGAHLSPHLLLVDPVRSGDVPALARLLAAGGRGIAAALEAAAMADLPCGAVDLVVRLGRLHDGLSGVVAIEDTTGTPIFVHEDGRFQRRPAAPFFAGRVHEMGGAAALSRVLA